MLDRSYRHEKSLGTQDIPPQPHGPAFPPCPFTKRKAFHGGVQREKCESLVVGLGTVKGDASDMSNSARQVLSVGFSESGEGKRALLSPHLALIADVAATNPLRPTTLEAVFRCLKKRIASSNDSGKGRGGHTPVEDLGGRDRRCGWFVHHSKQGTCGGSENSEPGSLICC